MILFIDNKQTPSANFRTPRYVLFSQVLRQEGIESELILGSWHHGLKKRVTTKSNSQHLINNISYQNHVGLKRLLSELLFGFQVVLSKSRLLKRADLIVINDSSIFYNYIFFLLKPFFNYKILLDSNDLWPEIFVRSIKIRRVFFLIKKIIYSHADFFIAVNKEYLSYYNYLKSKQLGVIDLGLTIEENENIRCNLFDSESRCFLYLGSLGVNYKIEEICQFILDNENYSLDCFGSGSKENIVKEYHFISKGRINLYEPKSLDFFKNSEKKYCFGFALYSSDSLVRFPTKLFDYWAFSLPVLVNVGDEVQEKLKTNTELGLYIDGDIIDTLFIENYLNIYNKQIMVDDFTINHQVLKVFNLII